MSSDTVKRKSHAHETVKRVFLQGNVGDDAFNAWLVREAKARGLDGWMRVREEGGMDAFFAGTNAQVAAMMMAFSDTGCPNTLIGIESLPVKGDEPIWSGFHHMPPV